MNIHFRFAAASAALGIMLAGCTGGQVGVEPPVTQIDVQKTTALQFAVGTANFGGAVVFNTLVTYRQANGLSGTLYNTPMITGPSGFSVPAGSPPSGNVDAGTSHISGTAPTQPGTAAVPSTFGQTGGAFAYGFAPENSTTSGQANYPGAVGSVYGNALLAPVTFSYTQPIYAAAAARLPFLLAPPATPALPVGVAGFLGYPSGFTAFQVPPVTGTYTLTVTVPGNSPGAAPIAVKTATATLNNIAGLPVIASPVITKTATGVSVAVAPPLTGVTHQILYFVDVAAKDGTPTFWSFDATAGGTYAVSSGLTDQDEIAAYVVGADYDILALAPPTNVQQTPALPAQADITVSPPDITTYVAAAAVGSTLNVKRVVR